MHCGKMYAICAFFFSEAADAAAKEGTKGVLRARLEGINLIHWMMRLLLTFSLLVASGHCGTHRLNATNEDIYKIAVCSAQCVQQEQFGPPAATNTHPSSSSLRPMPELQANPPESVLKMCYELCCSQNLSTTNVVRKENLIGEFLGLSLVCRTDRTLTFRVITKEMQMHENSKIKNTVYLIKAYSMSDPTELMGYLTDEDLLSIEHLESNSTYQITTEEVHANGDYQVLARQQIFSTLEEGFTPDVIRDIQIQSFNSSLTGQLLLDAILTWVPAPDMVCHYELVGFSPESGDYELGPLEIQNPHELYYYIMEDLEFYREYNVGIRAKNVYSIAKESSMFWRTFRTPACMEWYDYNSICPPLQPQELKVQKKSLGHNIFALNISWAAPQHEPNYYIVRVMDLSENGNLHEEIIDKNQNSVFIPYAEVSGSVYEIHLTAYTSTGNSTASIADMIKATYILEGNDDAVKLIMLAVVVAICVAILVVSANVSCKHTNSKKPPFDPEPFNILAQDELPYRPAILYIQTEESRMSEDSLEIDRDRVTLFEKLGEGEFGMVRRGIYTDEKGKNREVAVKMFKCDPALEDIHAFRREIEVMKSVELHPNIVAVIGHCTADPKNMLLLTEYCSFGSLLNYLRDEWNYIIEKFHTVVAETGNEVTLSTSLKHQKTEGRFQNEQDPRIIALTTATLAASNETYGVTYSDAYHIWLNVFAVENEGNVRRLLEEGADESSEILNSIVKEFSQITRGYTASNPAYFTDLKSNHQSFCHLTSNNSARYCNHTYAENEKTLLTEMDFIEIATQVAKGMEYLTLNKVVHRDLAARNILVTGARIIKIADFGLSRDIYQDNVYRKTGASKVPVKWMAPESLTHQIYTSQSDVWSFGVLLYEIFTFGSIPYYHLSNNEVLQKLKAGYRLPQPVRCRDEVYVVMSSCWKYSPIERPTFTQIVKTLEHIMPMVSENSVDSVTLGNGTQQ